MYLLLAAIPFLGFWTNVIFGATLGKPLVNDILEMLLLLASIVGFVAAILFSEYKRDEAENKVTD